METGVYGAECKALNVCIVGGGATGVELAAELRKATEQFGFHGLEKLRRPHSFNITFLQAGPRLLAALPEGMAEKVHQHLGTLDIDVRISARVEEVTNAAVRLADGTEMPAQMTIWATGIKAPEILSSIKGLQIGSLDRAKADRSLQAEGHPNVYALGDCADITCSKAGRSLPPRAQVASQQAKFLEKQLMRSLAGETLSDFEFPDRGSLVSVADKNADGAFMGKAFGTITFEGLFARISYRFLKFSHETAVQGFYRSALKSLLSSAMKRLRPSLKLH